MNPVVPELRTGVKIVPTERVALHHDIRPPLVVHRALPVDSNDFDGPSPEVQDQAIIQIGAADPPAVENDAGIYVNVAGAQDLPDATADGSIQLEGSNILGMTDYLLTLQPKITRIGFENCESS